MSVSTPNRRKIGRAKRAVIAVLISAAIALPLSPSQAEVTRGGVSRLVRNAVDLLPESIPNVFAGGLIRKSQNTTTPAERAIQITNFRLCPRRLSLYVGEDYTLVPTALDRNRETVHCVAYDWQTSNAGVVLVSGGTVEALSPGNAVVTVSVGTAKATVTVSVLPGSRPRLSDAEWDREHVNDCTNPEDVAVNESDFEIGMLNQARMALQRGTIEEQTDIPGDLAKLAKAAVARRPYRKSHLRDNTTRASFAGIQKSGSEPQAPQDGPGLIDGGGGDPIASQSTASFGNAIGSPRLSPTEVPMGSANKTKNNLGSYNYSFVAR